jgi:hypothetical protein
MFSGGVHDLITFTLTTPTWERSCGDVVWLRGDLSGAAEDPPDGGAAWTVRGVVEVGQDGVGSGI